MEWISGAEDLLVDEQAMGITAPLRERATPTSCRHLTHERGVTSVSCWHTPVPSARAGFVWHSQSCLSSLLWNTGE